MTSKKSNLIYRFMPSQICAQLETRREMAQSFANMNWLLLQTGFNALLGFLVGIWVARYLGPARYGALNYAVAFVSLLSPAATVGLGAIVVRDLVRAEGEAPAIMGSTTFLRALGSAFLLLAGIGSIIVLRPHDRSMWLFVGIVSLGHGLRNLGVFELWFQAKVQAKYIMFSRVVAGLTAGVFKLSLIAAGASLVLFVSAYSLELILTAICMLVYYTRTTGVRVSAWRVSARWSKDLFSASWPLIFSGIMAAVYLKIDQVMIGQMRGNHEVGVYAIAVRISENFYLLSGIVLVSVFPSLVKVREISRELYMERHQRLYDAFVWFAIVCAVFVQFAASIVIRLLFGKVYSGAAPALAVHIWCGVFWFSGSVGHRYLITEDQSKVTLYMTMAGALVNIALNFLMIPQYGIMGAAWATLLSFSVSHWSAGILFRPSRITVLLFLQSFNPIGLARRWIPVLRQAGLLRSTGRK